MVTNDAPAYQQYRDVLPDEGQEDSEKWREALRDRYTMYVLNGEARHSVQYSLWITVDEYEYPLVQLGGVERAIMSRHTDIGNGFDPTDTFFEMLGTITHEAMASFPPTYWDDGQWVHTLDELHPKARVYERQLAVTLAHWFTAGTDEYAPELVPLAEYASSYTAFGVPYLTKHTDL